MNIMFLTHRVPYPPDKGDKLRAFNIIKHLSARHSIYLFSASDNKADLRHKDKLANWCMAVHIVYINFFLKKILSVYSLFTKTPLSLFFFYSGRLKKIIREQMDSIDLIYVYCSSMGQYAEGVRVPVIMDFIDADSDKWRQYAKRSMFPMRFVYKRECALLSAYEKRISEKICAGIVVSEPERRIIGADNIYVVPNGVDYAYFNSSFRSSGRYGNMALFAGDMSYPANVDAVLYFYKDIWPLIKARLPDAVFYAAGRNPSRRLSVLYKDPSVVVTGAVCDMRRYIAEAKVCVAPMRIARGIQNKVLEPMSMGRAVVASPEAVQGINAAAGREIFVEATAQGFADKVVLLMRDKYLREKIGKAAAGAAMERYNWDKNLKALDEIIEKIC